MSALALALSAPSQAADGTWDRAFGKDVDASQAGTGYEVCTVAANCKQGAAGGLGGELWAPEGLATDAAGNLYVADAFNERIQKFDSAPNFLRAFGKDVDASQAGTGFEVCTVAANCQAGDIGGLGGEFQTAPRGLAMDGAGNLYVADTDNQRIQKFDSAGNFLGAFGKDVDASQAGTGFEVCTVAVNCQTGAIGGLGGEFQDPWDVATDAAGNFYVADVGNARIQKFDSAGNFLRAFGKDVDASEAGTGFEVCTVAANCKQGAAGGLGGEFFRDLTGPEGLATDAAGNLYVADTDNQRIQKFDSAGNFLRAFGKDVDASQADTGYEVCTVAANCQAGDIGELGGEFILPWGVATDAAGNLYVADRNNERIQMFAGGVDTTPPETTIDSGPSGTTNDNAPTFGFSSSEPGSTFQCSVDGAAFAPCSSPYVAAPLPEGAHGFAVRAIDVAGNPDPSPASRGFAVDTVAPETTIDSGPSGTTNDNAPTFGFSSSEPGSTFQCSVDGAAFAPCSSPYVAAPLPEGAHGFAVRAIDVAGNPDPSPASRGFAVDTQPPVAKLSGKGMQKASKPIKIKVGCAEDCAVVATGKVVVRSGAGRRAAARGSRVLKVSFGLKEVELWLTVGHTATLKLRPKSGRARLKLKRLVRKGMKARAGIRVTFTDRAGNSSTEKLTIWLRKR